jgi:Beta-ketoacyl synthase, N-terminal domain
MQFRVRKLNSNVIAISSNSGIFSAITEAIGLFSDGEKKVRIVVAAEPTPEIYKMYCDFPDEAYAYSLDLIPAGDLSLNLSTAKGIKSSADNISINLDVLKFLLSKNPVYEATIDNTLWQLRRA